MVEVPLAENYPFAQHKYWNQEQSLNLGYVKSLNEKFITTSLWQAYLSAWMYVKLQ